MTAAVQWPASVRYQDATNVAPGGLGFVQDLLNTASQGKPRQPDLLEAVATAQEWLDLSLAVVNGIDPDCAPEPKTVTLDARGLRSLRSLRDRIRTALTATTAEDGPASVALPPVETTAAVRLDSDGARLRPRGKGVELVRSYALIQLTAASYADTMRRLKVCANPRCRGAFYDRSKNCSRIWHDVATCGNAQNVRVYRARLKARAVAPSSD
ncbi:CGNR zinc finger domain-containing protein [Streptomyces sp. NPDC101225]|uniref:CGNR zinc finger domain-containing protein n=1 Tax=Streptomyces sp. NPDC101225 TaxID=3366135 RepID=UPI003820F2A6